MTTKSAGKTITVTVGDLIAAVFDVVGDHVDAAVDLLRFEDLRATIVIDGPNAKSRKG